MTEISPRNPIDHLRLLIWLFWKPNRFRAFTDETSNRRLRTVGAWMSSTLTWLPLLIITLGYVLNTIPGTNENGLILVLAVIAGWLVTGWLGAKEPGTDDLIAGLAAFVVAFPIVLAVTDQFVISLIVVGAAVIARGVAVVAALGRASGIAGGVQTGLAVSAAVFLAGTLEGGVQIAIAGIVAIIGAILLGIGAAKTIARNRETGRASFRGKLMFVVLILSYASLIWIYLLGGWYILFQVQQSVS